MAVHFSRWALGEHEFALRLPAMVGYWVGLLCLYAFLQRRLPAIWALNGTVLSMTMAAFDYSFESRSYGIFYGCAMAAFFCWTCAVDVSVRRTMRRVALLSMFSALIAGVSTNYFAVLAVLPIAAGEAVRSATKWRRQALQPGWRFWHKLWSVIDVPVVAMLLLSLFPLVVFRSMIAHSIAQFGPHAWNKVSLDQVADSYTEMVEAMLYPLLALMALYGFIRYLSCVCAQCLSKLVPKVLLPLTRGVEGAGTVLRTYETVGVFMRMAYPFLGYLVASVRGGMLSPRFVIPVCYGFAIAGAVLAYKLFGQLRYASVVILCFCLAWFIARESYVGYQYSEQKQCFYKVLDRIPIAESYLPGQPAIAIPDPLMALTLQHYAPSSIASRIVFPVDFPAIRKFRSDDSPEQNIWAGRNTIYTLKVLPLAAFQQRTGAYLVLASDRNWLLQDLDRHHYAEHRLPIDTRAGGIGGFTPLSHGLPAFYRASGGLSPAGPLTLEDLPIAFSLSANLPDAPDME